MYEKFYIDLFNYIIHIINQHCAFVGRIKKIKPTPILRNFMWVWSVNRNHEREIPT